MSLFKKQ